MRTRMLLAASAVALVAASCSQPEPHVLSEAPRATTTTDLTPTTETSARDDQPGRFIARCATEADGGEPGMTIFTDGSEGVTDHCLSRYYMGVQPAPGALYVPDEDTGTYAPSRQDETQTSTPTTQWTPSEPRTDVDPDQDALDDEIDETDETDELENGTPTSTEPGQDEDDRDESEDTSPTSPDEPDPTTPTDPDQTTIPGTPDPTDDEGVDPTVPTTVPTVTESPDPTEATPPTSVDSTESATPAPGDSGSGSFPGSVGSHDLPFPFGSAQHQSAPPTSVPTPAS